MTKKHVLAFALVAAAALALAGCSADAAGDDGKLRIVASTDVYGDIAATIAGDAAEVTSLMTNAAQDPHSFEASAQNQLAVSKADIVIENGGGYDDFMGTLLAGAGDDSATVLNVVKISGKKPVDGELNEHVWYDFGTIGRLASALSEELSAAVPAQKATFQQNAARFASQLDELEHRAEDMKTRYAGAGVAVTEPVPLYLLQAIGLKNKTPAAFSHAIEEGRDISPAVLRETLALFSGRAVKLLAYNEQTAGPETDRVVAAAKAAGVPVVPMAETVPKGTDYIGWMTANLDAVQKALA